MNFKAYTQGGKFCHEPCHKVLLTTCTLKLRPDKFTLLSELKCNLSVHAVIRFFIGLIKLKI